MSLYSDAVVEQYIRLHDAGIKIPNCVARDTNTAWRPTSDPKNPDVRIVGFSKAMAHECKLDKLRFRRYALETDLAEMEPVHLKTESSPSCYGCEELYTLGLFTRWLTPGEYQCVP